MRRALLISVVMAVSAAALAEIPQGRTAKLDIYYEPTPMPIVELMLKLAKVKAEDYVIDLGCGDGRIPVTAAKQYGARGFCIDADPRRVREAEQSVARADVAEKVTVREGNLFDADLSEATVVTLFLSQSINLKLRPKLLKLAPGTRVVSLYHNMADWQPDSIEWTYHKGFGRAPMYLWVVPAAVDGPWQLSIADAAVNVRIRQRFQHFTAAVADPGSTIKAGRVNGAEVRFSLRSGSGA